MEAVPYLDRDHGLALALGLNFSMAPRPPSASVAAKGAEPMRLRSTLSDKVGRSGTSMAG